MRRYTPLIGQGPFFFFPSRLGNAEPLGHEYFHVRDGIRHFLVLPSCDDLEHQQWPQKR